MKNKYGPPVQKYTFQELMLFDPGEFFTVPLPRTGEDDHDPNAIFIVKEIRGYSKPLSIKTTIYDAIDINTGEFMSFKATVQVFEHKPTDEEKLRMIPYLA